MAKGDVVVDGLWKTFRIYHQRNSTLKQAILRRRADVFDEFWALKDVSFEVPAGSTFGLIGANGAGKSTMLKVLSRILVPDKGAVRSRRAGVGAARAGCRLPSRAAAAARTSSSTARSSA